MLTVKFVKMGGPPFSAERREKAKLRFRFGKGQSFALLIKPRPGIGGGDGETRSPRRQCPLLGLVGAVLETASPISIGGAGDGEGSHLVVVRRPVGCGAASVVEDGPWFAAGCRWWDTNLILVAMPGLDRRLEAAGMHSLIS